MLIFIQMDIPYDLSTYNSFEDYFNPNIQFFSDDDNKKIKKKIVLEKAFHHLFAKSPGSYKYAS